MTRFTIFYEYDGGGTDWAALYAKDANDARRLFNMKYDERRILRIEADLGQPEGWN